MGKVIINSNHFKSLLATIHTMFINKKIIRIYLFCLFSTWNTRQMYFKRSIVIKSSPPWPPKIPHCAAPPPFSAFVFEVDIFNDYPCNKNPACCGFKLALPVDWLLTVDVVFPVDISLAVDVVFSSFWSWFLKKLYNPWIVQ